MSNMEHTECDICANSFTKSTRKPIECCNHECDSTICLACVKYYLLDRTEEPHCMNCNHKWDVRFLNKYLPKATLTAIKKKQGFSLLEKEEALLPITQDAARNQVEIDKIKNKENEIQQVILEYQKKIKDLKIQKYELQDGRYLLERGNNKKLETTESKKTFIRKCPRDDCDGFLSSQWKCGLCDGWACRDCFGLKNDKNDEEHTCNDDDLKSAEQIRKDTKPCPTCGIPIFKLSGCNQMWCVKCNIAFDWTTLRIERGVIHNPHYYDWIRANNDGNIPRNRDDICGVGFIHPTTIRQKLGKVVGWHDDSDFRSLFEIHRRSIDARWTGHDRIIEYNTNLYKKQRIHFLLKRISKNKFSETLTRLEKKRKLNNEKYLVRDCFYRTVNDLCSNILEATTKKEIYDVIDQIKKIDSLYKMTMDEVKTMYRY